MATMTAPQENRVWAITTRAIVFAAIGAALYAVLNWASFAVQIPGTQNVSIRPQFGIVTFVGFAFGPFAGLFTGLVGNAVGDQLTGWGAFTSWHWSVANGLAGLLAGLGPSLLSNRARTLGTVAIASAVAGVVATVLGFLFIFIEFIIQPELGAETIIWGEYIPTVLTNSLAAAIVTPILVVAWESVREQMGR